MVDVEKNIRKRNTLKKRVDAIIEDIKKELKLEKPSKKNLTDFIAQLSSKQVDIRTLNTGVEKSITDPHLFDAEVEASELVDERIIGWRSRAEGTVKELESEERTTPEPTAKNAKVKLPQIVIEKFDGNPKNWLEFWTQFSATIHNQDFEKGVKFTYLKSYLEGTALNCVDGLSITAQNYDYAIDLLQNRFGRKDVIIHTLTSKLLGLQSVEKIEDIKGLRSLYDAIEVHIRSLEAMEVKAEANGILLCPIILNKIPTKMAFDFTMKREDSDWTVEEVMEYFRKQVENRERASSFFEAREYSYQKPKVELEAKGGFRSSNSNQYRNSYGGHLKKNPSTAAFSTQSESKNITACIFCNKSDHKTEGCTDAKIDYDKRLEILKKSGRCFLCTKERHRAQDCRFKGKCHKCNRRHVEAVCRDKYQKQEEMSERGELTVAALRTVSKKKPEGGHVLLHTIHAQAIGTGSEKIVRCFFDGGAERSFVCEDVSRSLNLPVLGIETLDLYLFQQKHPITVKRRRVELTLKSLENANEITLEAIEIPRITSATLRQPEESLFDELRGQGCMLKKKSIKEQANSKSEINVLIGADYLYEILTGRTKRLSRSSVGVESLLGWSVHGRSKATIRCPTLDGSMMSIGVSAVKEELVSSHLRSLWELESLGIVEQDESFEKVEREVMSEFQANIVFKNGRYEVSLPWKKDIELTSNNYEVAKRRFKTLLHRFQKDPNLLKAYSEIIQGYLKDGIAEVAVDLPETSKRVYYLPHHPVIKINRLTTKVRPVFDASSYEGNSPSLNDCLHVGKNMNTDLFGIIIKFRRYRVAFVADIEKAFLQVGLRENDRDATRFLWFDGQIEATTDLKNVKLMTLRMTRVIFGCTSSPFLLAGTIRHHIEKYKETHPKAVGLIEEHLYIDDLVGGEENETLVDNLAHESQCIFKEAGMELKKWQTNSSILRKSWREEQFGGSDGLISAGLPYITLKVLGIVWDYETDTLRVDLSGLLEFLKNPKDTKRFILHSASRIFDPIGFISPFVIRIKQVFQQLWERGTDWDEEIPKDLKIYWKNWCKEVPELQAIRIPRYYENTSTNSRSVETELHCFCDASEKAYGACVYARFNNLSGRTCSILVASKSRLAPIKKLTIPRLELMAAVIGVRLMKILKPNFPNSTYRYWSDSSITLSWIRGHAHHWKPFVANRVAEIQLNTDPGRWKFCKGRDNPADLLSRGMRVEELISSEKWWTGPSFFRKPIEQWAGENQEPTNPQEYNEERRPICVQSNFQHNKQIPLLDLSKYRGLNRILRVTAWIKRLLWNMRNSKHPRSGALAIEEIQEAEEYWLKVAQNEEFSDEIRLLADGGRSKSNSSISSLNPFLDIDGLLRVGGRLELSDLEYDQRHPYIIPCEHPFTKKLIMKVHTDSLHVGVTGTITQIRERYWVPRARQVTKRVLDKCLICKKYKVKPAVVEMAPLPKERLSETPPFEVSGIDFAGPVYIKSQGDSNKAYIALFTCSVTRAIHLELVTSLSTENFILAMRRFISRRGLCKVLFSDNAKTFKCAERELKALWKAIDIPKLKTFFGEVGIQWKYIVERAAWWGGFWERLVRSVKTPLKKILGRALLNYEEMMTVLTEVEAQINSRPLTYVGNDPADEMALTPAHFLIGRRLNSLPTKTFQDQQPSTKKDLTRRMKYRESLMQRLWTRWRKEYIMELRSAHYKPKQKTPTTQMQVDDIVLIVEDKMPRHLWSMGRITDIFIGRDGLIRSCAIRKTGGQILKRPVQLLCPLELG